MDTPAILAAFLMTVRVLRAKKSILRSPSSSTVVMVNWVTTTPSFPIASGIRSSAGAEQITTPAACTDGFLGRPSSLSDISMSFFACSSFSYRSFSSGFIFIAFVNVILGSEGTIFDRESTYV